MNKVDWNELADEAERGYDVSKIKKGEPKDDLKFRVMALRGMRDELLKTANLHEPEKIPA